MRGVGRSSTYPIRTISAARSSWKADSQKTLRAACRKTDCALSDQFTFAFAIDFDVRFGSEFAYLTPLTPQAVEFIEQHILGAIFENGALVVGKLMGELMTCSMRREGLRLAVRGDQLNS